MKKTICIILSIFSLISLFVSNLEESTNKEQKCLIENMGEENEIGLINFTTNNSSEVFEVKNEENSLKPKEKTNTSKDVLENSKIEETSRRISQEVSKTEKEESSLKSKENSNTSKNVPDNSKSEDSKNEESRDVELSRDIPESKILNVKNIQQLPEYEAGCEITSTTILLNYYGFNIKKTELVKYLPTKPYYYKDGKMYCGDPNKEFCGAVDSNAYGCFSGAIMKTIKGYFSVADDKGYHPVEYKNEKPETLYHQIAQGKPVIVWATIYMKEPFEGDSWIIEDTNKTFVWPCREHCLVLIGYTKDEVVLSDPYDSRGTVRYSKELFEKRFKELGGQAIVLEK